MEYHLVMKDQLVTKCHTDSSVRPKAVGSKLGPFVGSYDHNFEMPVTVIIFSSQGRRPCGLRYHNVSQNEGKSAV